MEGMIWALIVVTGAANVNVSTGYPNKTLCEDAASIARTGKTVAEQKAADEAEMARRAKLDREYEEGHPPRQPTKDDEQQCTRYRADGSWAGGVLYVGGNDCYISEKDGLTHFSRQSFVTFSNGGYDAAREIKYAKCVLVDPKDR